MSNTTPRTDAVAAILNQQSYYGLSGYVTADFARQLETELANLQKRYDDDVAELNARLIQRREDYAAHSVKQAHELQSLSARLDAANQDAERLAEAAREFARKNPRFIALDGTTQDPLGVHATLAAHAIRIKTP